MVESWTANVQARQHASGNDQAQPTAPEDFHIYFNPVDGEEDSDEELGLRSTRRGWQGFEVPWLQADPFLREDTKPKQPIQFFLEIDFQDEEVTQRLPQELADNEAAKRAILELVRAHVQDNLQRPTFKFFVEVPIEQDFEWNGVTYALSYYMMPPRKPAPVKQLPPTDKSANLAANLEKEPYAIKLAVLNILTLFVGFALSLVGVACELDSCDFANDLGQFITALAALSLALVATYMSFVVATYD